MSIGRIVLLGLLGWIALAVVVACLWSLAGRRLKQTRPSTGTHTTKAATPRGSGLRL